MEATALHTGVINGIQMEWVDTATTAEERAAGRPGECEAYQLDMFRPSCQARSFIV